LKEDKTLLKHGSFLFILSLSANFTNYFYHVFMTRQLGPDKYGILCSLIAILNILGVAPGAIQLVCAQRISACLLENNIEKAKKIYIFAFKWTFAIGLSATIIYLLVTPFLKGYLKINQISYLLLIGIPFLLSFIYPVITGGLQGTKQFMGLGLNSFSLSITRLIFGVGLVWGGWSVLGGLLSFPVSILFAILYGLYLMRPFLKNDNSCTSYKIKFTDVFGHILPTIAGLALFQLLTQMDLLIVKRYFPDHQTGLYSAVSTLGKAFLTIPTAFTLVMVPDVSGKDVNAKKILDKALLYGFSLCLVGISFCILFNGLILRVFSGPKYTSISYLLQLFPIAITPLALCAILLNFQLARLKIKFIFLFTVVTILQWFLLERFHQSFTQILAILLSCGMILFILNYILITYESRTIHD